MISIVDKVNFRKLVQNKATNDICIDDFKIINSEATYKEILLFLLEEVETNITKKSNHIAKYLNCILLFLDAISYTNDKLDIPTISRLLSLNEKYKDNNSKKNTDEIEALIEIIIEKLQNDYDIDGMLNERVGEEDKSNIYYEEISRLSIELDKVKKELEKTQKEKVKLEKLSEAKTKSLGKEQSLNVKLNGEMQTLNAEKDRYKKQLDELQSQLIGLQKIKEELEELQSKYNKLQEKDAIIEGKLNESNKLYQQLLTEYTEYKNNIENERTKEITIKEKNELIVKELLGILFTGSYSRDELLSMLKDKNITIDYEELNNAIAILETNFNLHKDRLFTIPEKFTIARPIISVGGIVHLETENPNKFECIITSDWHYNLYNSENVKTKINLMYEYMAKHGINNIINLGDLFDINQNLSLQGQYDLTNKILEQFYYDIPMDVNVKHIVLGGNHDADILNAGIDSIKTISKMRRDIYPIGYHHAELLLNARMNNKICLSHITFLKENLKPINERSEYFLFRGHSHICNFDSYKGYASVPTASSRPIGNSKNGAYHVIFYFNEQGLISNMCIKNLIYFNELEEVSEFNYQKLSLERK